tara:strand:+ start:270 stop:872 length:603 start_codon:yes stop_codon:yes gene_type:complete
MYKLILFSLAIVFTQETISTDSLAALINNSKYVILDEVIYEDPLANKTMGIMFNPIATILYDEGLRINGGFSYFPKNKRTELYLGYQYINESDNQDYQLDIDILNRLYFARKYRKGFHLLYGTRFTSYKNSNNYWDDENSEPRVNSKLGVSFGVGYRIFSKNGLYWGTSLYVGRHLLVEDEDDDHPYLWMELFKIGYLFK